MNTEPSSKSFRGQQDPAADSDIIDNTLKTKAKVIKNTAITKLILVLTLKQA